MTQRDGARDHDAAATASSSGVDLRRRRRAPSTRSARAWSILAANGIGTPRLLLLSGGADGLANSSGMVGKRLMMHPFGTVVGLFEDELRSWQGPWGQ